MECFASNMHREASGMKVSGSRRACRRPRRGRRGSLCKERSPHEPFVPVRNGVCVRSVLGPPSRPLLDQRPERVAQVRRMRQGVPWAQASRRRGQAWDGRGCARRCEGVAGYDWDSMQGVIPTENVQALFTRSDMCQRDGAPSPPSAKPMPLPCRVDGVRLPSCESSTESYP